MEVGGEDAGCSQCQHNRRLKPTAADRSSSSSYDDDHHDHDDDHDDDHDSRSYKLFFPMMLETMISLLDEN